MARVWSASRASGYMFVYSPDVLDLTVASVVEENVCVVCAEKHYSGEPPVSLSIVGLSFTSSPVGPP